MSVATALEKLVAEQAPASHVAAVTPNDGTDLTQPCRAFSVGVAGDLKVTTLGGETLVIPEAALVPGVIYPVRLTRVFDTGTSADGILVYW